MDVGIAAKAEVTIACCLMSPPIHMVCRLRSEGCPQPRVAERSDNFLDFSQLHKIYPTPKGPLTVVEDFDLKIDSAANSSR